MEYVIQCKYCDIDDAWTTQDAATAAAVWHVYREHRQAWNEIMGDRPPAASTPPEAFGRKL